MSVILEPFVKPGSDLARPYAGGSALAMRGSRLENLLDSLEQYYGCPEQAVTTAPFEAVLWENVAYLATDERREDSFEALRQKVGIQPAEILAASGEVLLEVARRGGILPEQRVENLRRAAEVALSEFAGSVDGLLKLPLGQAVKALQKFPCIGVPGAEKILLFARSHPAPALDSNGVRVLLRLGYGKETGSYTSTYRAVQEAILPESVLDCEWLIRSYQLIRRHGKEQCRRVRPECACCPVSEHCPFGTG